MERKLLDKSSEELKQLFEDHVDNPESLFALLYELTYRSAKSIDGMDRQIITILVDRFSESFKWPNTDVVLGGGGLLIHDFDVPEESPLKLLGYTTGRSGAGRTTRRRILRRAYHDELPEVHSRDYMAKWGSPHTSNRLRAIATHIASLTRNAKRKNAANMSLAISHWEEDLQYLRREFYAGVYDFSWPSTTLA